MTQRDSFHHLQKILWNFASHRVLTVAARTGILRSLCQFSSVENVAREQGLSPVATGKIIRVLCALEIAVSIDGSFVLKDGMKPLFDGGPRDMTAFLDHSHQMYESWGKNLEGWARGQPFPTRQRTEEGIAAFGKAMESIASNIALGVTDHLSLDSIRSVLDVGGGTGTYVQTFCQAAEHLHGTVLDSPQVARLGEERVAAIGLGDRIQFRGGDYLQDSFGGPYDLVLLANVLHQELPDGAEALVRKGAEALTPGGRVAIVDFSIDDEQSAQLVGTLFAVNMRSFGDTYPEPILREWMTRAGLKDIRRIDLDQERWLFIGDK